MKQVMIKQGQSVVKEVPAPTVEKGRVLVQVDHSCISPGTELSGMKGSAEPLWKKALKNPHKIKKAVEMVMAQGFKKTKSLVQGKEQAGYPTGYSAAGTILQVGAGVTDLRPGDHVACAGAQCAHHAEVISVPRNLTVSIPDNVSFAHASTVTMGAIAMQGIRRAEPTLGETFVVIGLGFLGQLTTQFLKLNGCHVVGIDLDVKRTDLAEELGMDIGFQRSDIEEIVPAAEYPVGYPACSFPWTRLLVFLNPCAITISTAFFILWGFLRAFFHRGSALPFIPLSSVPGEMQE